MRCCTSKWNSCESFVPPLFGKDSVMQAISMERVRELDVAHGQEIRDSLRQWPVLPMVLCKGNVSNLSVLAKRLGVSLQELCSYVWLQTYIVELRESFEDLPSLAVVAQQFGISSEEFENYISDESRLLQNIFVDNPTVRRSLLSGNWDNEEDLLEDLQNDAGLQGD